MDTSNPDPIASARQHSHFEQHAGRIFQLDYEPDGADRPADLDRWYRDPMTALADLAALATQNWDQVAGQPGIPDSPPADQQLALNIFFSRGRSAYSGYWSLSWAKLDAVDGAVNTTASGTTWRELQHVFVVNDELHCLCGNEPSYSGFFACTPDGRQRDQDTGWEGHYCCADCYRIVSYNDHELGLIVGVADPEAPPAEPDWMCDPGSEIEMLIAQALLLVIGNPGWTFEQAMKQAAVEMSFDGPIPPLDLVEIPTTDAASTHVRIRFEHWGTEVLLNPRRVERPLL